MTGAAQRPSSLFVRHICTFMQALVLDKIKLEGDFAETSNNLPYSFRLSEYWCYERCKAKSAWAEIVSPQRTPLEMTNQGLMIPLRIA
jgi:predicted nucleic acid binding AN1-type Zn finger protein